MGTIFLRSDSDKWGQGLKWGQSEIGDNMLFQFMKEKNPIFDQLRHQLSFGIWKFMNPCDEQLMY